MSREAVERHYTEGMSLGELGQRLGVSSLVAGRVRRDGDRVRITAQLIDAATEQYRWAESYDREFTDVFDIQGDIAAKVVSSLNARLSTQEGNWLRHMPTANLKAWEYVERARQLLASGGGNWVNCCEEIEQLVERALDVEPEFAPAHALRSLLYYGQQTSTGQGGDLAVAEAAAWRAKGDPDKMLHAGLRAVRLKPSDLWALRVVAVYYGEQGRFVSSHQWATRAAFLSGDVILQREFRGWTNWIVGDYAASEEAFRGVLELDPNRIESLMRLAEISLSQGRVAKARVEVAKALALEPDHFRVLPTAGLVEIFAGQYEKARAYLEQLLTLDERVSISTGLVATTGLGYVLGKMGDGEGSQRFLEESIELNRKFMLGGRVTTYQHAAYDMARVHAIRGNLDEANRWVRKALDHKWPYAYTYMGPDDPMLENLRGNATFESMMAEAHAELDRQRERLAEHDLPPSDELYEEMLAEAWAEVGEVSRER
jgi:adenylate cyclase